MVDNIKINPQRVNGYMPTVKNKDIPKRLLFFDTETKQETVNDRVSEHKLHLGVAIYVELTKNLDVYKREVYKFRTQNEFIDILKKYDHKKKKLAIFAHNIKFDIMVLDLPFKLMKLGYDNPYPIVNGMVFIWNVKLDNGKFSFLDTANYAGFSLAKIGKDMGIKKMDIDFNNATDEQLFIYCENDVHICEMFIISMLRFLYENNLGAFKFTLASQAFNVWRYKFMNVRPYITLRPDILEIERNAYYGGRTETFIIGKIPEEKVYYVDINSAYPYSMKMELPTEPLFPPRTNPTYKGFLFNLKNNYVIADVSLNTKLNAFPLRYKDKLCFPIGEFRTILHQPELEYAVKYDLIDEIHVYQAYRKSNIFNDYIDFFYGIKERATIEHNGTQRLIAKLFMNSLYGKFGQVWKHTDKVGNNKSLQCYIINNRDNKTGRDFIELCWYGDIYKSWNEGEDKFSIPSISGAITAYGRMLLWDYMQICGMENVYYVDTDSIMTNFTGYKNLKPYIDDTKLGYMALEDTSNHVFIHGAKDYEFNSERKIKGVPKTAIETMVDVFQFTRFEGFLEWRNRGGKGSPRMLETTRERKNQYDKGFHTGKGKVSPLVFNGEVEITSDFYG